jgi:protein-tyrosine-phosphatase/predicted ATP-grasp superfamily ATP-dependent carboligase
LGDPAVDLRDVRRRLITLVSRDEYDLLIPITDTATELCAGMRESLEERVRLAMPSAAAYEYAHDKARLLELAARLGIPVPEHVTLRGLAELASASEIDLGWPCYVKPIHSVMATPARLVRFQVTRVADRDELIDIARFHLGRIPIIVQRLCPGVGVGIYVLCWQGRIHSIVQQRRLHEPHPGGASSYRITETIEPNLRTYAEQFVAATRWSGVAMLEFKGEATSKHAWLMEVNGRFWGSLPLTIRAGLDYPLWLVRLCVDGPPALPSRLPEPRLQLRQRHMRHDVVWAIRQVLREENHLGVLAEWLRGFRHVVDGTEAWDTEQLGDPIPALAEWWQDALRWVQPLRRRAARIVARIGHAMAGRRDGLRSLAELAGQYPRILFVCTGNICRSPFAEQYMRQRLAYAAVRSCGTGESWNRLVPVAVERTACERFGVDLREHRSSTVSRDAIEWADAVVAMDDTNLAELRRYRGLGRPTILLGDIDDGRVVRDPYGGDASTIERTFVQMAELLGMLHRRIVASKRGCFDAPIRPGLPRGHRCEVRQASVC